jgi:alpha-N-arabinofuranosidase
MSPTNPVIPGYYPDPSICRVGQDYYLVTSTFEYFPGVPVFHSRDLANWRQIGHCLTRPSQLPLEGCRSSGGIFAPTIRYHNGTFYMVTTNVTGGGHFYVSAVDPAGEWSEPIWYDQGVRGIDPSLFFDDDGTVYFTSTGGPGMGIVQTTLDIATGQRLCEPRSIWNGTGGSSPEAPHLYKIGGTYYLMLAEGGTEYGHMVTIARSDNPWGPFESCPFNPILSNRSTPRPIQATGHADLFQAHDGSWWLVFLGIRPRGGYPSFHVLGRETFLAPVRWTEDGWPVAGEECRAGLEIELPWAEQPWPQPVLREEFAGPTLPLYWNHLRNPRPADYSLTARPGWMRLYGSAESVDDLASPAFIGRRQQDWFFHAETLLEFDPAQENEEAGLTALMNERHHYEVAVTRRGGERKVIVRRRIGSLSVVVAEAPLAAGPVRLSIRGNESVYRLAYAMGDAPLQVLAQGEARYLSKEVAGGFNGVYLGLYATGHGQPCTVPADFAWFDYQPEKGEPAPHWE